MSTLARRLAITIAVPLALYFAGEHLLLPGIGEEVIQRVPGSHANVGVLALGIMPIVTAYWVVEVIAFLVPGWRRLRHGNPEGRVKLDRAARVLALVLAAFQGFGIATQLGALSSLDGAATSTGVSIPLVMLSLMGGLCLQFVAARLISQRGLANGFVVLLAAGQLGGLLESGREALGGRGSHGGMPLGHGATPREVGFTAFALLVGVLATWLVLGRPSAPPRPAAGAEEGAAPYRGARQLVVHPWIPLPASSLQAYVFATSLLMVPQTLAAFHIPTFGLADLLQRDAVFVPSFVVVLGIVMVVFARLMHRPAEMSDLALRLGAKALGTMQEESRAALRRALLPTSLYFLVAVLLPHVSRVGFLILPMIAAAVIDIARSIRIELTAPGMVPVWEERRASAVAVLRAALAADGIPSEARGMAVLSLWQVFAPYAPAEILVPAGDAERATKTLRHWLLGEEAPQRAETSGDAVIDDGTKEPWPAARRNMILGGCAVAALAAFALFQVPPAGSGAPAGPRAKLEVVRVDDTIDPFASLPESAVPAGEGIEIRFENVPAGPGRHLKVNFARLRLREGESTAAGVARFRRWLATLELPPGARFGIEEVGDYSPETQLVTVDSLRSFVLTGEPILRTEDVTDAMAMTPGAEGQDVYVAVTLSSDAAQRFEDATREWTQRRIAIVLDDVITSAPIVKTAIGGGRISITMGMAGDPARQAEEARALVSRLRGR